MLPLQTYCDCGEGAAAVRKEGRNGRMESHGQGEGDRDTKGHVKGHEGGRGQSALPRVGREREGTGGGDQHVMPGTASFTEKS